MIKSSFPFTENAKDMRSQLRVNSKNKQRECFKYPPTIIASQQLNGLAIVNIFSHLKTHSAPKLCFIKMILIILIKMTNKIASISDRRQRFSQLRNSIQQTTTIGSKTAQLKTRFELMRKNMNFEDDEKENILSDSYSFCDCSSEDDEIGGQKSFLEKYQLLEKLGEGGNACVYRCQYKKTGKFYAIKKFRIEEEHIMILKKSFLVLKQLQHPSIIKYRALHIESSQNCAYVVMDYFPFPSISECKIKDEAELKIVVQELIAAMKYFHDRNICHRDIKPQNILYNKQEKKIKIIDFCISKKTFQRGSRRDMLTIIGTPYYLAPEVYIGGGYDERVDIWALGVTIYKIIAGYTPFQSEYHSQTISNILKGDFSFDQKIWQTYSSFLKDFISQLLKKSNQRLSLIQAQKHLWLRGAKKLRVSKCFSQYCQLSQEFHYQMNKKMRFASSREQGETQEDLPLQRVISSLGVQEFQLQDSDDEQTMNSSPSSITFQRKNVSQLWLSSEKY